MSLTLLDWRRTVVAMYAAVREGAERDPDATLAAFRADRERLIREHPQSPIRPEKRAAFEGLDHWPRDPALRFEAVVEPAEPERLIAHSLDGDPYPLDRIGRVRLPVGELEVYWIEVYGGGVFVPFRDATSGTRELRRRPLPARHDQGRRPGRGGGPPDPRLQLRLQPVMRLRPPLELPAGAGGQLAAGADPGG